MRRGIVVDTAHEDTRVLAVLACGLQQGRAHTVVLCVRDVCSERLRPMWYSHIGRFTAFSCDVTRVACTLFLQYVSVIGTLRLFLFAPVMFLRFLETFDVNTYDPHHDVKELMDFYK